MVARLLELGPERDPHPMAMTWRTAEGGCPPRSTIRRPRRRLVPDLAHIRRADTYHGRFVKLVTNEQVVEVVEFETTDPALSGEMTSALADSDGGTDVLAVHEGLPRGLPPADNEAGWRSSLAKLAALVEGGTKDR